MKTLKIEQVLKDLYESNVYLNHRMVYDYVSKYYQDDFDKANNISNR